MIPNFNNYGGMPVPLISNLTPEQQKKKDEWELDQKRKIKSQYVKNTIRQSYIQLVNALAASNIGTPNSSILKTPEEICREAMEIAKWGHAVWMEENPEDSAENVDDVVLPMIPPPVGGY